MNTCCKSKNLCKKIIEVGIDFGTTNCLLSYYDNEKIQFIENKQTLCNLFPSLINFSENEYRAFMCTNSCPKNDITIRSIKRILGLTLTEALKIKHDLPFKIDEIKSSEHDIYIVINNQSISKSVRDIVHAMMLGLKDIINNHFSGKDADFNVVITVPAYFDENARIIIKNAALLASFNVLRLINEPTAAALAYLSKIESKNDSEIYAVYDLGGGTFDISILKKHGANFFRVIGIGGDKFLGGDDIDNTLLKLLCSKRNIDPSDLSLNARIELLFEVKTFKEGKNKNIEINDDEFDEIVSNLIQQTIKILKETIDRSDIQINDISGIILAGGSSRLTLIKDELKKFFSNDINILDDLNPDEIVAYGAALHTHHLTKNKSDNDIMFIDANSMHLGLEVAGGLMEVLIESGAPIPITRKSTFTTQVDNQESMRISICQGMNKKFADNSLLGEFKLDNLTKAAAGHLSVDISFNIDADGILSVKAKESKNDKNDYADDKTAVYSIMLKK